VREGEKKVNGGVRGGGENKRVEGRMSRGERGKT